MLGFLFRRRRRAPAPSPPSDWKAENEARIARLRRQGVAIGTGCVIFTDRFSIEPFLIELGDRVAVAAGTTFLTHDGAAWLLRRTRPEARHFGLITVGSDTFIGQNCIILPGGRIGSSCVVGAGSVVRGTVADGTVVMGNPARIVGDVIKAVRSRVTATGGPAARMGRHSQFAVAAATLAVAHAGLDLGRVDRGRCGCVLGCCFGDQAALEAEHQVLQASGPRRVAPTLVPIQLSSLAAGEVAIHLGLRGLNYVISAACASANHALGLAARHVAYGDADVVLAGGTEAALTPLLFAGFGQARALATGFNDRPEQASRPFDAGRRGFVPGEGAAVLVLESLDHARARGAPILAAFAGVAAGDDAHHVTAPDPEGRGLADAIMGALADAGLPPEAIDYVSAHGTSTVLNDKLETRAIKRAFGDHARSLVISATKSQLGHPLGAASALVLAATVLAMRHGLVPPTLNLDAPDPECDLDYVPHPLEIRAAVSNACGFGGQNSALVIRRPGES